jgi:hypothetical protein
MSARRSLTGIKRTLSYRPQKLNTIASPIVIGFVQTLGSVRVIKALHKIKNRKERELLVNMVDSLPRPS